MKFTANYDNLTTVYRLKNDGFWKLINEENVLYEDDMVFDTPISALKKINSFFEIKLDENIINPKSIAHVLGDYFPEIITHRLSKPQYILTREDLKKVLLNGDDRYVNVLLLDFDGKPKLIPLKNGETPLTISYYPVRNESYMFGNGYVGNEKSIEDIDLLYTNLLSNWLLHLETGKSQYTDYFDNVDEETTLKRIKDFYNNI